MNITIEVANETILGITEACNITFWEQFKQDIMLEIFHYNVKMALMMTLFATFVFGLGWFAAGWHKRKREKKQR